MYTDVKVENLKLFCKNGSTGKREIIPNNKLYKYISHKNQISLIFLITPN